MVNSLGDDIDVCSRSFHYYLFVLEFSHTHIEQELRAIYLLEMTKCLTGIFGRGLPWDIQNRTS